MNKYVVINYTGKKGAGPIISINIASALKNKGYKIIAIISMFCENISDWDTAGFYKVIKIKTYRSKKEFINNSLCFNFVARKIIKKELKDLIIDFVYCPM